LEPRKKDSGTFNSGLLDFLTSIWAYYLERVIQGWAFWSDLGIPDIWFNPTEFFLLFPNPGPLKNSKEGMPLGPWTRDFLMVLTNPIRKFTVMAFTQRYFGTLGINPSEGISLQIIVHCAPFSVEFHTWCSHRNHFPRYGAEKFHNAFPGNPGLPPNLPPEKGGTPGLIIYTRGLGFSPKRNIGFSHHNIKGAHVGAQTQQLPFQGWDTN